MSKSFINNKIKSIAHRGFEFKDNSFIACNRAFTIGFDMIELDVQVCKDDIIFYHDVYLNNTKVKDLTYQEIKEYDKDIMNFDFFFNIFGYKDIDIYLDLKGPIEIIDKIFNFFENNNIMTNNFYIASFNLNHINKLNEYKDKFKFNIGFITCNNFTSEILDIISNKIDFIVYDIDYLNDEEIELLKSKNKKIFTYTLKCKKRFEELIKFNIDGIVSDILF